MSFLNIVSAQKAQYSNYDVWVPVIEPIDSTFFSLLDHVLELDENCSFYSDSLWYSIALSETTNFEKKILLLQFGANESRGYYLENVLDFYKGVIKHKNHYFFIRATILPQYLFKTTNDKYHLFGFYKKPSYHNDDSWPEHLFAFDNGDYYYLKTSRKMIRCP
jgi:hypothetical protein